MKKKKDAKSVTASIKGHIKGISAIVVGYGVAEIMGNVMKEYKPDVKGLQKVLIKIGAVALTGMVIKSVNDYVDGEIDDIFEMAEEVAAKVEDEKEIEDEGSDD